MSVYTGYVGLVGWAGPVFAAQISYLLTDFGVLWACVILSESRPLGVWYALDMMMLGMYLVQPRKAVLEAGSAMRDSGR